jgi:CBS-domain-containing membrane protein
MVRVRVRTIPTERPPLVGEVLTTFADKGCHVVSVADPYGRILGFLDRCRYFSMK